MPIRPIDIEDMSSKAENIYEAIVVMSKRARQVNEEMKIEFNQRIEMLQSKIFEPEDDSEQPQTNPDQILIAREFEQRQKPPEVAINELESDNLTFRYKEDEQAPTTSL